MAALSLDPGLWMMHCHILEHAESGMMSLLEVAAPDVGSPGEVEAGER